MGNSTNKIKYRALIISILSKYLNSKTVNNIQLAKDIKILSKIEDKDLLANILFKEMLSDSKIYADICANIAIETISEDAFHKHGLKILEDDKIADNKKFFIISILEHKGIKIDYDGLNLYLENPIKVANEGINEFLHDSLNNPESRIDLLDFFENIPDDDRLYLLQNLSSEYSGDILANAFYTVLKSGVNDDELDLILSSLLKTDSMYSYKALKLIKNQYSFSSINKLKINNYIKTNCHKYENKSDYFLISNSAPHTCYMSFVDGNSNFSLIFSRKFQDDSITAFFTTINISYGVTSCIGFHSIDEQYFAKIIKRLFTDSLPVKLDYYSLKGLLEYFSGLNIENNYNLPYEFLIWNELTSDIEFKEKDVLSYIASKLAGTDLNKIKFEKISKSKLLEKWYFSFHQNKLIDNTIDKITKANVTTIEALDELVKNCVNSKSVGSSGLKSEIKLRLLLQSYVSSLGGFSVSSSVLFELYKNNTYFANLVSIMIYKSIYVYLNTLIDNESNTFFMKNNKINIKKEEIIDLLEKIEDKFV